MFFGGRTALQAVHHKGGLYETMGDVDDTGYNLHGYRRLIVVGVLLVCKRKHRGDEDEELQQDESTHRHHQKDVVDGVVAVERCMQATELVKSHSQRHNQ